MPPVPKPKRVRSRHFIQEWRKFRNLTQEQVAARIGISRTNYLRAEAGKVPYSQDILELLADALNCSPADLLMRDPLKFNAVWSLEDHLKQADKDTRDRIMAVVQTLLKSG
jgi:transcriptional regulator with XRE-family HTH domain